MDNDPRTYQVPFDFHWWDLVISRANESRVWTHWGFWHDVHCAYSPLQVDSRHQKIMDKDLAQSFIRKALTAGAGYLVARGMLPQNTVTDTALNEISALIVFLISAYWSKRHQTKMKGKLNEKTKS